MRYLSQQPTTPRFLLFGESSQRHWMALSIHTPAHAHCLRTVCPPTVKCHFVTESSTVEPNVTKRISMVQRKSKEGKPNQGKQHMTTQRVKKDKTQNHTTTTHRWSYGRGVCSSPVRIRNRHPIVAPNFVLSSCVSLRCLHPNDQHHPAITHHTTPHTIQCFIVRLKRSISIMNDINNIHNKQSKHTNIIHTRTERSTHQCTHTYTRDHNQSDPHCANSKT